MNNTVPSATELRELCTGLILAGGAGRRVGGRDKGLMRWLGKPLIAHVAECLEPQVGRILVSCNRNLPAYQRLGFATVSDLRGGFHGPLAGLEGAASQIDTPFLVVVACDTPRLPPHLVRRLLAPLLAQDDHYCDLSYATDGTRAHYLCAALRSPTLAGLSERLDAGQRTVREWYRSQQSAVVDFSDCRGAFANFNHGVTDTPGT